MLEVFRSGGYMMWPMLFVAIGVLALAVRSAMVTADTPAERRELEQRLQSIVFWGVMGAVLGLLGTVVGFVQMAHAIQTFGSAMPATIWGGVGVALVTLIFGLLILLAALLIWFALRLRMREGGRIVPT